MNDTLKIMFYENSGFWDDAMSGIGADVVKEIAHVQSLSSKENLTCIDPEDGDSKLLKHTVELS
jgi:hypothetical protein